MYYAYIYINNIKIYDSNVEVLYYEMTKLLKLKTILHAMSHSHSKNKSRGFIRKKNQLVPVNCKGNASFKIYFFSS